MNAITKAISDIKFQIPIEILNLGFVEKSHRVNQIISLDERIMSEIMRPRILIDCNLVGGIETRVDLNRCKITPLDNREFVVEVPKALTNNKNIITALSVVSNVVYSQSMAYADMSPFESVASNMMSNLGTENVVQTSRLELIGDNVVLIQDPNMHFMNGVLRCMVENNTNLENINPRSYLAFSKLCVLGVKSYIRNKMRVKLNQGQIYGGHELGVVKDIIEEYSDAEEMYQEYLNTTWRKISFINDSDAMSRYTKSMLGNTI